MKFGNTFRNYVLAKDGGRLGDKYLSFLKLKEIIKGQFEKPADQQSLAGFNLNVSSKDEYDHSDLKRFLVQQKFIMEDTLLELAQKSIHRFVDCIISFLPISCTVRDTHDVTNVYYTEE